MPKYLRRFAVATLAVASVLAAWVKCGGHWQLVAAQDATYRAAAPETSAVQADSKAIFFSAKQLESEIWKAPQVGPSTFRIDLIQYSADKGGADVLLRKQCSLPRSAGE